MEETMKHGSIDGGLVGGEFLAHVQAAETQLRESDRTVIAAITADPQRLTNSTVTDLAANAGTSQSSVVRACQRLGFKGFQDAKIAVVKDLSRHQSSIEHPPGIDRTTPADQVITSVFSHSGRSLTEASATLDARALSRAATRLGQARYTVVIGNGTSAASAHDCAYRLSTLGKLAHHPTDAYSQHLAAAQLKPTDCCIAVSHTGATHETLQAAQAAKETGAFIIAITSFLHSPLTAVADTSLVAGAPEQAFRQTATASRLAHLSIVDALIVILAQTNPEQVAEALDTTARIRALHSTQ